MRTWLLPVATVAFVPAAARAQRVVAHDTLFQRDAHRPHLRLLRSDEECDDSIACTLDSCGRP